MSLSLYIYTVLSNQVAQLIGLIMLNIRIVDLKTRRNPVPEMKKTSLLKTLVKVVQGILKTIYMINEALGCLSVLMVNPYC